MVLLIPAKRTPFRIISCVRNISNPILYMTIYVLFHITSSHELSRALTNYYSYMHYLKCHDWIVMTHELSSLTKDPLTHTHTTLTHHYHSQVAKCRLSRTGISHKIYTTLTTYHSRTVSKYPLSHIQTQPWRTSITLTQRNVISHELSSLTKYPLSLSHTTVTTCHSHVAICHHVQTVNFMNSRLSQKILSHTHTQLSRTITLKWQSGITHELSSLTNPLSHTHTHTSLSPARNEQGAFTSRTVKLPVARRNDSRMQLFSTGKCERSPFCSFSITCIGTSFSVYIQWYKCVCVCMYICIYVHGTSNSVYIQWHICMCVCMYICTCVYTYMCTYVRVNKFVCMRVCLYAYICVHILYTYILVWVCRFIFIFTCMYTYIYICMFIYMYVYICRYVYIYIYIYMCICIFLHTYMYIHICIYLHVYIYICMHIYIYMYVCIYMYTYI